MNSTSFEQAKIAYSNSNYVDALKGFYTSLKEDSANFAPGEIALVYYRIGNCLLKMHNFNEAAATYQKAIEDPDFADKAVAQVNLGKSLLGLGRYEEAITSFNSALADPSYAKPYQAQLGLGNAYSKLGLIVDAGTAYRNAALDERNPNPAKALMSLGLCFMALGRPQDAIESYNAIFDFNPSIAIQHKTYESLGQALTAVGRYQEAVESFGKALADGGFKLSTEAQADYAKALQFASTGSEADSFADVAESGQSYQPSYADGLVSATDTEPVLQPDGTIAYGAGNVPTTQDTGFFDVTEADLVEMSKIQIKGERKLRHTGLKVTLIIVIILILALGGGVFAFTQGYGYPSQETTIKDVFAAKTAGSDPAQYWIGSTDTEEAAVARIMDMVGPTSAVDIIYLNKTMTTTDAIVTAHLAEGGGTLNYQITLERSGIGWKISGLDLYFASKP